MNETFTSILETVKTRFSACSDDCWLFEALEAETQSIVSISCVFFNRNFQWLKSTNLKRREVLPPSNNSRYSSTLYGHNLKLTDCKDVLTSLFINPYCVFLFWLVCFRLAVCCFESTSRQVKEGECIRKTEASGVRIRSASVVRCSSVNSHCRPVVRWFKTFSPSSDWSRRKFGISLELVAGFYPSNSYMTDSQVNARISYLINSITCPVSQANKTPRSKSKALLISDRVSLPRNASPK